MFSCVVRGKVVAVRDEVHEGKPRRIFQLLQKTRNGFASFVFVRCENGLQGVVGDDMEIEVDALPYVRKNGSAEVMLRVPK